MAVLGMDQYGLLLANLIPASQIADNLKTAKNAPPGLVTVFLPSKFITLINETELPKTWETTSDSIAAYIAKKLEAEKLLLIKNVDGIFTDDPKKNVHAKLLEHLTIKELFEMKNKNCIDAYLPKLLKALKINCYIVNGFYPERIEATLNKQKTTSTTIVSHK
jgi:aspartokinase-like uncharacterized kinase